MYIDKMTQFDVLVQFFLLIFTHRIELTEGKLSKCEFTGHATYVVWLMSFDFYYSIESNVWIDKDQQCLVPKFKIVVLPHYCTAIISTLPPRVNSACSKTYISVLPSKMPVLDLTEQVQMHSAFIFTVNKCGIKWVHIC